MVENAGRTHKGAAHARGRNLPKANEERLAQLATRLPPPSDDQDDRDDQDEQDEQDEQLDIIKGLRAGRRRRHLLGWAVALVVLALGAGAIAQWVRPLPHPTLQATGVRLPGMPPTLAWPSAGEAAVGVEGVGPLGQLRGNQSVPVAGLAEVLTAYVVLSDHHLAPGADGPSVPVTADTLTAYQNGQAAQDSEVPVTAGETLTELQALEGMLIDSGTDMATMLADWDAGAVGPFVAKMNAAAAKLGLTSTHVTDPSGVDPGTTSTAEDLVRLGEAALSIPVLQQIVSLGQTSVSIPMTTAVVYNLNFDLGHDGIVGIKTGSNSSAKGCYLFAAQESIGGKTVTVVGAVLGQPGGSLGPNTAAVNAGDALVKSAFASLHTFTVFAPGQQAGEVVAPWGAMAPTTVAQPVTVVGWPGLAVSVTARRAHSLDAPIATGATVGTLQAGTGSTSVLVPLRTARPLGRPGLWWRLTR
jgi:D-alanyl-D-alanine carboxypeptidase (penicillin-binding protein 5/6)